MVRKTAVLCAVILTVYSLVLCAASGRENVKPFEIDGVGTFFLPAEIRCAPAVGTQEMKNIETQYDLTYYDDESAHYARLVIYQGQHSLGPALGLIDLVEFKPELVTILSDYGQRLVSKKLEERGGKCLDWLPAHKLVVQKHNGVQFGARLVLSEKLPIPMFASVAVFSAHGKITGIALICPDSDRTYWQPVFKHILQDSARSN